MWYEQIDTAGSPAKKYMREMEWALEWSEPVSWLPRTDYTTVMDYAIGGVSSAASSYTTKVTGPDGKSNSAYSLFPADALISNDSSASDYSISFWLKGVTVGNTLNLVIYNPAGDPITIRVEDTGTLQLNIYDNAALGTGIPNASFELGGTLNDWRHIVITNDSNLVRVYIDGSISNTANMPYDMSIEAYIMTTVLGHNVYGLRIVPRVVSAEAILYMYRDVTENSANATEPAF
jgi:hypothetical protein